MTPNKCLCYVRAIFNIQENDCMAHKLKYTDAQQKKEVAEKKLTRKVRLKLCSILASYTISMCSISRTYTYSNFIQN